jgi:hypothetical protein
MGSGSSGWKERAARRIQARYDMAIDDKQAYSRYLVSLNALLELKSNSFRRNN